MSKKSFLQKKLLDVIQRKKLSNTEEIINAVLGDEEPSSEEKYKLKRTLKRLCQQEMVELIPANRSIFARLTNTGRKKLRSLELDNENSLTPMKWDGYWRVVLVNIPEHRKDERDAFRYLLKKANFVCIKNAVWVSPFPLEHLLENLKKDFGFIDEILIILTSKVDKATEEVFLKSLAKQYN